MIKKWKLYVFCNFDFIMNSDISIGKLILIFEKWFICVNICVLLYKVKYVNELNCFFWRVN